MAQKHNQKYNRTVTPEKWQLVSQENKDILQDFLIELKSMRRAPRTIKAYEDDLRIILVHIMEKHNNKSVIDMNRRDWRSVSLWLSDGMNGTESDSNGRSNARVNRMRAACNSLCTYLENSDDYDYEINYSKKIAGLPQQRVKTNEDDFFFTFDEFIEVRNQLIENEEWQIASFWTLAYDSGARKNEICQIQKNGFYEENSRWTNVVVGKRGKEFKLMYLPDSRDIVLKWLEVRGEDSIDSLWVVGDGEERHAATPENLYGWIKKCSKILSKIRGEETNIFVHTTRHSRAESLVSGQDNRLKNPDGTNRVYTLNEVRLLLHHESAETTQGYLRNHDDEILDGLFGM